MKKIIISRLFLYKYRFLIGYIILGLSFVCMLFSLPLFSQYGLSNEEIQSATNSFQLSFDAPLNGDLVNLPYRALQKISIMVFGLTPYAIKLPSILIGLLLGFLLILLLNRWFKNNVSLLASILVILSTPFLFLAGSGTPLIMIVFWPTLLLWLGSKIQGEKRPKPAYSFLFAICLLLSVFTPYMIYFAIVCVVFVFLQPHLRFILKSLPKLPLVLVCLIVLSGIATLAVNIVNHPDIIKELFFARDFEVSSYFKNLINGIGPVFSWRNTAESVFLSPLLSLPLFSLALIGLFSTTKGFFASRNSIASLLILFTVIITGFNSDAIIFFILPLSILVAHGLKYLLEKWYGLFPENPYARVAAALPLSILFATILIPSTLQYIYGYRYNPNVAGQFSYNLNIIREHIHVGKLYVNKDFEFYEILERSTDIDIVNTLPELAQDEQIAVMGNPENLPTSYQLSQIITSPMRENSDIIYLYTAKGE